MLRPLSKIEAKINKKNKVRTWAKIIFFRIAFSLQLTNTLLSTFQDKNEYQHVECWTFFFFIEHVRNRRVIDIATFDICSDFLHNIFSLFLCSILCTIFQRAKNIERWMKAHKKKRNRNVVMVFNQNAEMLANQLIEWLSFVDTKRRRYYHVFDILWNFVLDVRCTDGCMVGRLYDWFDRLVGLVGFQLKTPF